MNAFRLALLACAAGLAVPSAPASAYVAKITTSDILAGGGQCAVSGICTINGRMSDCPGSGYCTIIQSRRPAADDSALLRAVAAAQC